MPLFFLLHNADHFFKELSPPLGEAWRGRNFQSCRELCTRLLTRAAEFAERFHVGSSEPLLTKVLGGLPFSRSAWRYLVGEVLLYGADEIPDLATVPGVLHGLVEPGRDPSPPGQRDRFVPIEQVHFGTRDLVFGSGFYRPEAAGLNDLSDVARLANYLEGIDPWCWSITDLASLDEKVDEGERSEELDFMRDLFPPLRDLYRNARDTQKVIVCEEL
jgi:hypothetical protein